MEITCTKDFDLIAKLNQPIHDLHVSLYPQYFMEYDFAAIRESFKQWMMNDNFIFLLLVDDDEPIGYAWIELKTYSQNAFKKSYQSIYVHQISIVEKRKRRGYGSKLMDTVYDIAMSKGIELVELDYWASNILAENFYKKQGFVDCRKYVHKQL